VGVRAWGARHFARRGFGVKNKRSAKKKKLHRLFKEFRFPNRDGRHSLPRGSTINLFLKKTQVRIITRRGSPSARSFTLSISPLLNSYQVPWSLSQSSVSTLFTRRVEARISKPRKSMPL